MTEQVKDEVVEKVETGLTEEKVKLLFDLMPPEGWVFLTSCYNNAQLPTSAVDGAYHAKCFLKQFHANPHVIAKLREAQPQQQPKR